MQLCARIRVWSVCMAACQQNQTSKACCRLRPAVDAGRLLADVASRPHLLGCCCLVCHQQQRTMSARLVA